MEPTDWIAIYAALVATAALGWQMWERRQRRRAQVKLSLGFYDDILYLYIRNRGDHPVRIMTVRFENLVIPVNDDARILISGLDSHVRVPNKSTLGLIPPHDAARVDLRREEILQAGMTFAEPVIATVTTATGDRLHSGYLELPEWNTAEK
jgi:hypothetical protein